MTSSKKLQQDLFDALIDAYPRREFLAEMLLHELDLRLEHFSGSNDNLRQSIQATMREAYENGRTVGLIQAAQADNPGNPLLREIDTTEYGARRYRWAEVREPTDYLARQRRDYLLAAENLWISMRLNESLEERIWLELGIEEVPEVMAGYDARYDHVRNGVTIQVDTVQPLAETFHHNRRSLLILGEPGSGKTTLLLKLAEQLFQEAIEDIHSQIPIILNLSSWAIERKRLEDWIGDELAKLGLMPDREVTKTWLQNRQVVLMLDALDEVAEAHRGDCLAAINHLRGKGVDLVVSCRDKEFAELSDLNINYAVRIGNFEKDEIVQHLQAYRGRDLGGVIDAVNDEDGAWADLLKVPLTLTLAAVALEGVSAELILSKDDKTSASQRLFHLYIVMMLQRRPFDTSDYKASDALRWLNNLSIGMTQHEQTQFFIEWLQPSWLPDAWLNTQPIWLMLSILYRDKIELHEYIRWNILSLSEINKHLDWRKAIKFGVSFGFGGMLILGVFSLFFQRMVSFNLAASYQGLLIGVGTGVYFGLVNEIKTLTSRIRSPETLPESSRQKPNQGTYNSFKNAVALSIISIFTLSFFLSILFSLFFYSITLVDGALYGESPLGLWEGLRFGFLAGLQTGAVIGVLIGIFGKAGWGVLSHYVLRACLSKASVLPHSISDRRLTYFLDCAKDRIILRRVGGGWEFVHRYLQDYFASLTEKEISEIADKVEPGANSN